MKDPPPCGRKSVENILCSVEFKFSTRCREVWWKRRKRAHLSARNLKMIEVARVPRNETSRLWKFFSDTRELINYQIRVRVLKYLVFDTFLDWSENRTFIIVSVFLAGTSSGRENILPRIFYYFNCRINLNRLLCIQNSAMKYSQNLNPIQRKIISHFSHIILWAIT